MRKSQEKSVLEYLQNGNTITPLEALNMFGSLRLAALIHTLKSKGFDIRSEMITTASGKSVAQYSLATKTDSSGQKEFV